MSPFARNPKLVTERLTDYEWKEVWWYQKSLTYLRCMCCHGRTEKTGGNKRKYSQQTCTQCGTVTMLMFDPETRWFKGEVKLGDISETTWAIYWHRPID